MNSGNRFLMAAKQPLLGGVSLTTLGWTLAFASLGPVAHAQTAKAAAVTPAADATVSEVVVVGIRKSIEAAIHTKKVNSSIVEVINAEDIGKLPDTSIAESIARLPGLTAQRVSGRDQLISIRGFGQDFSTALLNGREQVTTSNSRGVEYDQYPAELISSVVVAKTPDASLVGQGLVGTVQLNTIRPLEQSGRILSFQARGEMDGYKTINPDSTNTGYRFSGLYSDKFMGDTLGVMFGAAIQSSPTQCQCYNAWGFPNDANGHAILGGGKNYGESDVLDRVGVVGTIEYEPNENFHTTIDGFYSNSTENIHLRGVEFPLAWGGGVTQSGIQTTNGMDSTVVFGNVHGVQRNDYNQQKTHLFSLGWNTKVKVTDTIHANLDLSWSRAHKNQFLMESYTGTGYNTAGAADTVTVTQQPNGTYQYHTLLNYADPTVFMLTDPQGWGGNNASGPVVQAGYVNKPEFDDDLKAVRLDFDGDLKSNVLKDWRVGANLSQRQKNSNFTADFLRLPNGATTAPVPSAAIIGKGSPLGFLGLGQTLILDPLYLYNHSYSPIADTRPVSLVDDYMVRERVALLYGILDISSQLGVVPVSGNVGVQVVFTNQYSSGVSANLANNVVTAANITGSDNYTRVLPSLNLKFDVAHDTDIRFGAARTLARPRLDQEEITTTINTNITYLQSANAAGGQSYFSGSGGNIHLHPYISNGIDLTLEKYFGTAGYFSIQGYYKHLTDYVNPNLSYLVNFSAAIPQFLTPAQAAVLGTPYGIVSGPANSGTGDILGVEAALSLPFKMFTPVLNGFGAQLSASYTDSAVKYEKTDTSNLPVEGLSNWVATSTVYYEKDGWQARVNVKYRSSFLGEIAGLSASRQFTSVAGNTQVDAQVGYTFQTGPMKNLAILLQAKNINNSAFVDYADNNPRHVTDYQTYGPTYLFGASYKF